MSFWTDIWTTASGTKARTRTYLRIPRERILDPIEPTEISTGKSYFSITLSELFLEFEREWLRKFVPLAVTITEFKRGSEQLRVPVCVGNQTAGQGQTQQNIELFNTRVVGPVPYLGGGIAFFLGLLRITASNAAESICTILEAAGRLLSAPVLANGLALAAPLAAGMEKLLGHSETELKFGARDEFEIHGGKKFEAGYLAYIDQPSEAKTAGDFWVKEGRLHHGTSKDALAPWRNSDFCLVRLGASEERDDVGTLPFAAVWPEIRGLLLRKDTKGAQAKQTELLQGILRSPDLTDLQRDALMDFFYVQFTKEKVRLSRMTESLSSAKRSAENKQPQRSLDDAVKTELTRATQAAARADLGKTTVRRLEAIKDRYAKLDGTKEADFDIKDLHSASKAFLVDSPKERTRASEELVLAMSAG